MTGSDAVLVENLRVVRGGVPVLDGLTLSVARGTVTGLVGPSGGGKSTLLRSIVGVQRVAGGHITVLGAQILHQVARARDAIDSADRDAAAQAIGKARQALKLVRQMLPSSVVSTTVMDSAGNVLYEDVEDVRQGSVTVSRSFTAINVVSPIVESKQSAAETAGAEFEGKAMIEADVVVNLDFVDRRLAEANRVLATDPERADQSLFQAQTQGTNLIFVDIESPLDECREALRYAHRSAEAKQYRAAEANLRIARGYLMLYRET